MAVYDARGRRPGDQLRPGVQQPSSVGPAWTSVLCAEPTTTRLAPATDTDNASRITTAVMAATQRGAD
jgi:hypothetical protein